MECVKNNINKQSGFSFYYWRDNNGVEIDLVRQSGTTFLPIEIKSAQTYTKDFSKNQKKFMSYSDSKKGLIIYDGIQEFTGSDNIQIVNWKTFLLNN